MSGPPMSTFDMTNEGRFASAFLLVLTTISVAIRECSRRIRKADMAAYDGLLYFAYLCYVALTGFELWSITNGVTSDPKFLAIPPPKRIVMLKVFFVIAILWATTTICVKLSILFLYKKIFCLKETWFRIAWWSIFIYLVPCFTVVSFTLQAYTLVTSLTRPNSPTLPKFSAHSSVAITWLNALAEMGLLLLPIPHLIALQMTQKRKLALLAVFCVGAVATMASLARGVSASIRLTTKWTPALTNFMLLILTMTECAAGIMCASLATSKPFFQYVFGRNGKGNTIYTTGVTGRGTRLPNTSESELVDMSIKEAGSVAETH
ncbi:hypothetical protein BDV95DRAFT_603246 [Massariosphaeria phaeospora]|uniref:Rhodopsin domain-containing protein n=1 Tax=Massariosphaeria phaeospora TaxID=100035 RepID=A0A7C8MFS5_9PLEO|nr:hypothetical protein BDV95DRAFT_603246 [Massariosphaeria phaeospora]